MNKRFLLGAAVLAPALAAGSVAAAPVSSSTDNIWMGPYVGVNIGATLSSTALRPSLSEGTGLANIPPADITAVAGFPFTSGSGGGGFEIGGEAGYNYQNGNFVIGVETDGGYSGVNQSRNHTFSPVPPATFTIGQNVRQDWMWTLRPRIGYAWDTWLVYVTGGLAVTDARVGASYSDSAGRFATFAHTNTLAGGTVGVGGAWMFSPGWSAKLEYLYADFGKVNGSVPVGAGFAVFNSTAYVRDNVVRVGLDYKF
jgi:outer membrane immunogenic protein